MGKNKLLTAEQFLTANYTPSVYDQDCQFDCQGYSKEDVIKAMIEFTKIHCKEALRQASVKAFVEYTDLIDGEKFDYTDVITDDNVEADVNKKSILNAYNLDEIV